MNDFNLTNENTNGTGEICTNKNSSFLIIIGLIILIVAIYVCVCQKKSQTN